MNRRDLKLEDGKIIVHSDQLAVLKARAKEKITAMGRDIIRDSVIDEELEMYIEEIVVEEIADAMRPDIRAMIERGFNQ